MWSIPGRVGILIIECEQAGPCAGPHSCTLSAPSLAECPARFYRNNISPFGLEKGMAIIRTDAERKNSKGPGTRDKGLGKGTGDKGQGTGKKDSGPGTGKREKGPGTGDLGPKEAKQPGDRQIICGDAIEVLGSLEAGSVHCCVTSPPYWGLRDYGVDAQLGLEQTPDQYVANMVAVFRQVKRVLRDDGTLWLNLGDSYMGATPGSRDPDRWPKQSRNDHRPNKKPLCHGLKNKDLAGIPWRVAFALQADGWWLRQDIIWHKPNPMPESVRDRCTKAHEYIFLLSKNATYYYDADAIKEPVIESNDARPRMGQGPNTQYKQKRGGAFHDHDNDIGVGQRIKNKVTYDDGKNKRSVWTVPLYPYKRAHFATFPPDLIEPCILAGTSDKGCCEVCGAPWLRVVEKSKHFASGSGRSGNPIGGKNGDKCQGGGTTGDIRKGPIVRCKTIGWEPGCECNGKTIPCTVLDPFFGAGTTGVVAVKKRRRYVGIELNPEYAEMASERIAGTQIDLELA